MYQRIAVLTSVLLSMVVLIGSCCGLMQCNKKNLLADGLAGWQQIEGQPDNWKFKDGILYSEGGGGGWLSTTRQYSDFRLELEFRIPSGGNSGVFLRSPHKGDPAYEGLEIQVLDDYGAEYAGLRDTQYTGSIYDVQPPAERASKKANKWQKMTIRCLGRKVVVILNDKTIIETNLNEHRDKYDKHPGLSRTEGYIGLQNHGSRVEFRNIEIHEYK